MRMLKDMSGLFFFTVLFCKRVLENVFLWVFHNLIEVDYIFKQINLINKDEIKIMHLQKTMQKKKSDKQKYSSL